MILGGWGNYPRLETRLAVPSRPSDLCDMITAGAPVLARGAGRAYGDAAIGAGVTLSTERLNRMLAFDPETGDLTVEAGVRLNDIIEAFVPRGFFPPVVPGTALVSVGGMVAANVHGKNHHGAGGMGAHVSQLTLIGPDGKPVVCSPTQNETLEDKPSCQFDYAYKMGLALASKTGYNVAGRLPPGHVEDKVQLAVKIGHAGEHWRTACAEAIVAERLMRGCYDVGMIGQPQIIVGAKIDDGMRFAVVIDSGAGVGR